MRCISLKVLCHPLLKALMWEHMLCSLFLFALLVFPFGSHSAPDVAFLLVEIQYLPYLKVEDIVILLQPLGKILMYSGFGKAEMAGGAAYRGAGFDHVHSQLTGSLLHGALHRLPSDAVC